MDELMPETPDETPAMVPDNVVPESAKTVDPDAKLKALNTEIAGLIKADMTAWKSVMDTLLPDWKTNTAMRVGGISSIATDTFTGGESAAEVGGSYTSAITPDWALSKTKIANLYSTNPEVRITHEDDQYKAAVAPFAKALNYELGESRACLGDAMEEALSDVVNASGVGAVEVGYAARSRKKVVPLAAMIPTPEGPIETSQIPEEVMAGIIADHQAQGIPFPTREVDVPMSEMFYISRFSPKDLIVQSAFVGSNFDRASLIGRRGKCTWSEAKAEFGLSDEDREDVVTGMSESVEDTLKVGPETTKSPEPAVSYQKVYYWRYKFDPDEPHFDCIWKIVYVDGMKEPPVHEPWKGQVYDPRLQEYVGARRPPIRVLTLTYISDNVIPPSDSQAGRPQVLDMQMDRSQIFENRMRSRPIRWFDDTRVDEEMRDALMQGTWQGMIPVKGDGARLLGEVARASFPQENLELGHVTKADLMEVWQVGPNQTGTAGRSGQTAAETEVIQSNFSTRIGQERGRVARFVTGIAQVMAGWMVLYSKFPTLSPQERQGMTAWDMKHVLQDAVFKIRPDSTVFVDSESRIKMLLRLLNFVGKSGLINPSPIIAEIVELHGIDPGKVMIQPQTHEDKPKITLSISGKDDLQNPLTLAFLVESGQAPSMESLKKSQELLAASLIPAPPPQVQTPPMGGPPQLPPGQAPKLLEAGHPNPEWGLMPKVGKRTRDGDAE